MADPVYTTRALVQEKLPRGYSTTYLSDDTIDEKIIDFSRTIDSMLEPWYVPFNDIDAASPLIRTPRRITLICTDLVAAECIGDVLMVKARNSRFTFTANQLRDSAEAWLEKLASGKAVIQPARVTTETLTWGEGGQYEIATNEAFFAGATLTQSSGDPVTVIPDSVRCLVTGFTDFRDPQEISFRFDPFFQKYVLTDHSQQLQSAAATITYLWSYRRPSQHSTPATEHEGRFIEA